MNDKLCILSAAQKAPQIQGAVVTGGTAKSASVDEVLKQMVGAFPSNAAAVQALNPIFGFLNGALNEKLQYEYSAGGPETVREAVVKAIRPNVDAGAVIELTVRAAGMDAVYGYSCLIGSAGVYALPRGLIR